MTNSAKTAASVPPRRKRGKHWLQRNWRLYLMLLIPIVWYILFCYKPMAGLQIAFQKYNMSSLPYELVEAASIDGATDFQVLTRIFLPLSFSSLATLSLFYAVGKWNSFNDALYYITSRELQPLQLKLYNLIKGSQSVEVAVAEGSSNDLSTNVSESIQSATIIFATLPILIVYPFVQRYFVAGVTMGAVKG